MSRKKKKTPRAVNKKPAFLKAFAVCASLTEAAAAAKIDRTKHYDWLKLDAKYAAAFERAKLEAAQSLEDEAVTRAKRGVYEPLVYQGNFTFPQEQYEAEPAIPSGDWKDEGGAKKETPAVIKWRNVPGAPPLGIWRKSDGLLQFLLRGFMPDKYRQQGAIELSGPGGGPIPITNKSLQALTDDELAALIATAKKLANAGSDGSGETSPGA